MLALAKPTNNPKLKLLGFNNLTKTLSFNIYDICYARTKEHQQEYVEYIDEQYNAERLTAILSEVADIIGANILNVARKMDIPVVYASSSEVYGSAQSSFISETHPLDGQSPYSASKIAADRMCKAWVDTYGMKINVVRLFNTFGPFQAADGYGGVIARFVAMGMQGIPMTIFGAGTQERDYLYIDDAVSAYLLALKTRFDGPVNFGCGKPVSINDIAKTIFGHVGGNPETPWVHIDPRPGEVDRLCCDNRKALSMGWSPTVPFNEGVRKYVEWRRYTLFS